MAVGIIKSPQEMKMHQYAHATQTQNSRSKSHWFNLSIKYMCVCVYMHFGFPIYELFNIDSSWTIYSTIAMISIRDGSCKRQCFFLRVIDVRREGNFCRHVSCFWIALSNPTPQYNTVLIILHVKNLHHWTKLDRGSKLNYF